MVKFLGNLVPHISPFRRQQIDAIVLSIGVPLSYCQRSALETAIEHLPIIFAVNSFRHGQLPNPNGVNDKFADVERASRKLREELSSVFLGQCPRDIVKEFGNTTGEDPAIFVSRVFEDLKAIQCWAKRAQELSGAPIDQSKIKRRERHQSGHAIDTAIKFLSVVWEWVFGQLPELYDTKSPFAGFVSAVLKETMELFPQEMKTAFPGMDDAASLRRKALCKRIPRVVQAIAIERYLAYANASSPNYLHYPLEVSSEA